MRSTAARLALPPVVAIVVVLAIVSAVPSAAAAQEIENGTTTFVFELAEDGDAHVSVTTSLALQNENDRRAFDRIADEHTADSGALLSIDPFERAASLASEATGRPMEITDATQSASRENGTGSLTIRFRWTNFAEADDDRILVGDAFQTPEGTWLPGLEADQELVIAFPSGHTPERISMPGARFQVENGTIRVEGPASFGAGAPSVVLQGPESPPPEPTWDLAEVAAGGIGLLGLLGLLAYLVRFGVPSFGRTERPDDAVGDEGRSDAPDGSDPAAEPLLSDEERVLRLLEERNGRMKQVEIVEATDWSNAKVSQLLSEMEEADRIDKLRIGRENLISLPGRGPGNE